MAVTLTTLQPARRGFINNATTADAQGGETIVAAVSGKSHFITSITIACITAITVTIQQADGAPSTLIGPIPFTTTSDPVTIVFPDPIKTIANALIIVDASGAGAVAVVIQGYTE